MTSSAPNKKAEVTPELLARYKELMQKEARAEELLLQIMRHPAVATELLLSAAESYRASYTMSMKIRDSLRELFPPTERWFKQYPWNK
jgi:hypothetical protein